MNERTVRRSKQKLLELGFLIEIRNTGHGKRYAVDLHRTLQKADNMSGQNVLSDRTIETRPDKNGHLTGQKWSSDRTKVVTENKERLKGEEISLKDKSFKEAQAPGDESEEVQLNEEIPKRYGNAEVNEILDEWEEATGFSWHSTKQERFATNTLLRKYGSDATKALVRRVKVARRSEDQFAPQIAKPSQLLGKYEKLTALQLWEERQGKAEAKEAEAHAPAYVPEYMRPPEPQPEWRDVRPETPEEIEAAKKRLAEFRERGGWYKPKSVRKEGC